MSAKQNASGTKSEASITALRQRMAYRRMSQDLLEEAQFEKQIEKRKQTVYLSTYSEEVPKAIKGEAKVLSSNEKKLLKRFGMM